jgi:hypothetical protein
MLIVQNMKIICEYCCWISIFLFHNYRVQGGDSRKYCRVPIDDVHDAENVLELLRDAVNFICKITINFKCLDDFFSLFNSGRL